MVKILYIVWNSFKMALQELKNNKLRTFLSLFGITIGIFCIIGVLATVESLEKKIKDDIASLGSNTIYVDKWDYSGGPDYPWWKFIKRPYPKYQEMVAIRQRSALAEAVSYSINSLGNIEYEDEVLNGVKFYGITEQFSSIVAIDLAFGRLLNESEYNRGAPVTVLGYDNAENLFGDAERAVGKQIKVQHRNFMVVGVVKKQGKNFLGGGGWAFDEAVILPYKTMAAMFVVEQSGPQIMVKGRENISSEALVQELRGIMRSLHRLKPREEDDFALNDISNFSKQTEQIFGSVNLGGWAIAGLSLIVGAFGVANIMFVTVRERTSQIGLKKAIGAKSATILTEFLLESAFLCLIGGIIGLMLVFLLTQGLNAVLPFSIIISLNTLTLAISICLIVGVLAGIIPASIAAKMNPVAAIRTK